MQRITAVIILALATTACYREVSEAEIAAVRASGDRIIQQLEAFKTRTGRYPETLEEAHIQNVVTALGKFGYAVTEPGTPEEYFILRAGNYSLHGFNIFWNSHDKKWDQDE